MDERRRFAIWAAAAGLLALLIPPSFVLMAGGDLTAGVWLTGGFLAAVALGGIAGALRRR